MGAGQRRPPSLERGRLPRRNDHRAEVGTYTATTCSSDRRVGLPAAIGYGTFRDRCLDAQVAFFFKQWGGRTPKAGGRILDDRTWGSGPRRRRARRRSTQMLVRHRVPGTLRRYTGTGVGQAG